MTTVVRAAVPVPVARVVPGVPARTVVVRALALTVHRAAMPFPQKPALSKWAPMASLLPSVCARWPCRDPAPAPPKE